MAIEYRKDGPWELPKGWVWVRLGDISDLRGEKVAPDPQSSLPFLGMDDVPTNSLRIESLGRFASMRSAGNRFYPSDVLYGRLRPYLNKVVVPDVEGAASGEFLVLRPKVGIEPRFLQLAMHSRRFVNEATRATSGDRPRVGFSTLAAVEVAVAPTAEQRRIVARIDELFTEIADGETALARARADLDTWRRALLKAAVTGELTREWRKEHAPRQTGSDLVALLRHQKSSLSSSTNEWDYPQNALPETWAWGAVKQVGDVQLGRQRAPQHHTGKYMRPYLRVANVLEDALDLSDVKWMNFTPDEFKVFALLPGDVLLNEGQSPSLLGRPAIYRGEIEGCCFQKTLLRFRTQAGIVPEFALLVFRHYMHSGRFRRESRITTNIGHLTQVRFVVMEFPVPPTEEQSEIVQIVKEYEAESDEQFTIYSSEATKLRQSILKAAFEGQLVNQDPADEPAEVLLARLSTAAEIGTVLQDRVRGRSARAAQ